MMPSSLCPTNCDVDYNTTGKIFQKTTSTTQIDLATASLSTSSLGAVSGDAISQFVIQKNVINYFMGVTGCAYLRVYQGLDNTGRILIIVGADAAGKNINSKYYYEESTSSLCPNNCDVF